MWRTLALAGVLWASPALGADERPAKLPLTLDHFSRTTPRWFAESSTTVGFPTRGATGIGYGQPFWRAISLDAIGFMTPFFTQAGVAVTGSLPLVQLELGAARVRTFGVGTLPKQERYTTRELDAHAGHATYSALNATLFGAVPLRPLPVVLRGQLVATPWLEERSAVLEQNRFVLRAPLAGFVRAFALVLLGDSGNLRVGTVAESIWPGAGAAAIVRLGPCLTADLTSHTDLTLFASVPVTSPDDLALRHGAGGSVAFRYRLATGESAPRLP